MRLAILVSALAMSACSSPGNSEYAAQGSSTGGPTRSYDVQGFEKVALEGASEVVVRTGLAPSVRAEGDPEALDQLEIVVDGDTLRIGHKRQKGWNVFSGSKGRTKVFVTMPAMAAASIGGSGRLEIDKVEGEAFDGAVSGSGNMNIESLQVGSASFAIAGSGDVVAAGSAQKLDMSIAGSGNLDLTAVESRMASVSIAGSGNARAKAVETADISILGSGDVTMSGPAKCTISKAGSGNARCNA